MNDFGCSHCFQAEAELAHEASRDFLEVARPVDESHYIIRIIRCPHCRQSFVSVFSELIDWDDGDDSQGRVTLPITEEEAAEFAAQEEMVDVDRIKSLGQGRRSLWWVKPRGNTALASWRTGELFILPHD